MRIYKTPEASRLRAKARRDAIKDIGGIEYAALLEREREQRALFRQRHPDKVKASRKKFKHHTDLRGHLVRNARQRARKSGLGASITSSDIHWPTHCPVLGIELDYSTKRGARKSNNPTSPSLDRFDNSKGYVRGNVFVVSLRANQLKSNATPDELEAVARYARRGLLFGLVV